MAKSRKINPKAIFFTEKMQNLLSVMFEYPIFCISAPLGFGKTVLLREFYVRAGEQAVWISVMSPELSRFWPDLCLALTGEARPEGFPEFPDCEEAIHGFTAAACRFHNHDQPFYVVIDDAEKILSDVFRQLLLSVAEESFGSIRFVIASEIPLWAQNETPVLRGQVGVFQADSFLMNEEEVTAFYHLCGIEISSDDARYIANSTGGWFAGLHTFVREYIQTGRISPRSRQIPLVFRYMYDTESDDLCRSFLLPVVFCPSFTKKQLDYLAEEPFTDEDYIRNVRFNSFLYYNRVTGEYILHPLYQTYLSNEANALPRETKRNVCRRQGDWYRLQDDDFEAMRSYFLAEDYDQMLDIIENLGTIRWRYKSKEAFLKYFNACPPSTLRKYPKALLKFLECFYYFDEQNLVQLVREQFRRSLQEGNVQPGEQKRLAIMQEVILSLLAFNDLDSMTQRFAAAADFVEPGHVNTELDIPIFYGSMVFFALFYRGGGIDECLEKIWKWMEAGNKANSDRYFGLDYLARAEAAYLQCRWEQAGIFLQMARWRCDRVGNASTRLCILFMDAKLALLAGDVELVREDLEQIRTLAHDNTESSVLEQTVDLSECYFHNKLGQSGKSAAWIRNGGVLLNQWSVPTIGISYTLYGSYLLSQRKYSYIIALEDTLLQSSERYSNVIFKIYDYLFLAIAYDALGFAEEAGFRMRASLELSLPEKIYMPLVENYAFLSDSLMKELQRYPQDYEAVQGHISRYKRVISRLNPIDPARTSLSLGPRESEIARMVVSGATNDEIASALNISVNTVKAILKMMFKKLGISSRREIVKVLDFSETHP